jgi:hypothetical protein
VQRASKADSTSRAVMGLLYHRPGAPLNKSPRWRAPSLWMGCKAQTAAIAHAIARICNAADRRRVGCATREGLVQRCPQPAQPLKTHRL